MICLANASNMEKICHLSVNLLHAATWATRESCSPLPHDSTTVGSSRQGAQHVRGLVPAAEESTEVTVLMH
jgi:hypothetical protein